MTATSPTNSAADPAAPPIFRFVLELRVRRDRTAEFRAAWAAMAAAASRHPANLDQLLAQRVDDPDLFEITSDWTDPAGYHGFSSGSAHEELAQQIRACTLGANLRPTRHIAHVPNHRSEKADRP